MSLPSPGTTQRLTRHLRHLKPPGKDESKARTMPVIGHTPAYVQPKDRIAYWNLVPGDVVKLRAGRVGQDLGLDPTVKQRGEGKIHSVDKERNLAWLDHIDNENPRAPQSKRSMALRFLDPNNPKQGLAPNFLPIRRPVHYSNLMLKIPGKDIWASRIIRKNLRYSKRAGAFLWDRIAVYKDAEGQTQKLKIDWPAKVSASTSPPTDVTLNHQVKEESWLPWDPADPVLLPNERPRDSPWSVKQLLEAAKETERQAGSSANIDLALAQKEALAEAEAALKAGDHAQVTKALNKAARHQQSSAADIGSSSRTKTTYAGFQSRSRPTPPKVAQLPSASELLSMSKDTLLSWSRHPSIQDHISSGGQTFTSEDYLQISPLTGPASGGSWDSPITSQSSNQIQLRDPYTGQLPPYETNRKQLDSMPIELLMKDDLTNEKGLKWRMRRYKEKKEAEKLERIRVEQVNKDNLEAFRDYLKLKRQAQLQEEGEVQPPQ
ncbi:unnamed protein product [Sympodiomycopsis kandeliae]